MKTAARRHQESQSEGKDDPDGAAPHGALLLSTYSLPRGPSPRTMPPRASHTVLTSSYPVA